MITRINDYLHRARALFEEAPHWVDCLCSAVLFALLGVGLGIFSAFYLASEQHFLLAGILSASCMVVIIVGVVHLYKEYKAEKRYSELNQHADHLNNLATMLCDALHDEMRVYAIDSNGILHLVVQDPENEYFFSFFSVDSNGELFHFSLRAELCANINFLDPNSGTCDYEFCDEFFVKAYHETRNQALNYWIDSITELIE